MKKISKRVVCVIFAAGLLLAMTACGKENDESSDQTKQPGQTAQTQPTSGPDKKSKLTVAIEATGDIPVEFQKQMDRFNSQSDTAEVEILTYAGAEAYETAILGQVAGNTAPDVILLDGGKKIQEYAENGVIIPVDEYLGDLKDNFEQSLLEALMYNGQLYGLTKDYNTSVLFYQTDMLKNAGIEVPSAMVDFVTAVEKLTTEEVYGFGADPKLNYLYPFAVTMGADFIGEDGTIDSSKLMSEGHRKMLEMFKNLYDEKQATSPYLANAGWDGELFGNAKVALMYGGSWITGVIADTSKAGVAPLPAETVPASMLYTTGWCITSQCKDPQSAADLIRFLSSDEELVEANQQGLIGLPPTKTAMDKLIEVKKDDPFLPVYKEVVKNGIAFGLIDGKFVDSYNKAFENMIYNNASVEDTLNEMAKAVK
jgi:multiple sugar transport system substrate-binding protein